MDLFDGELFKGDDPILPEMENRYDKLSKKQQDDFMEYLGENLAEKIFKLPKDATEDELEESFKELVEESFEEVETTNNWRHGLNLL